MSDAKKNVAMLKPTADQMAEEPGKMDKGVLNVSTEVEVKDESGEAIVLKPSANPRPTEEFDSQSKIIKGAGHKAAMLKAFVAQNDEEPGRMDKGNPNTCIKIDAKDEWKDDKVLKPRAKNVAEIPVAHQKASKLKSIEIKVPSGYQGSETPTAILKGSLNTGIDITLNTGIDIKVNDDLEEAKVSKPTAKMAPGYQNIKEPERIEGAGLNTSIAIKGNQNCEAY